MNIKWYNKTFKQLNVDELYRIIQLREEVFILEQACKYTDLDNRDQDAIHLLGALNNTIVSYTRIFPPNSKGYASFGRVLLDKGMRNQGLGHQLVQEVISIIGMKYGYTPIKISAQAHLTSFYEKHGFKTQGVPYLDAGIPHIDMIRLLKIP